MKASLLALSLILLAVLGACSDEGPAEAGNGESRDVEEVVTSIPFTDPTARLIVDESGDLESRLDAIDAIGKGASRQLVDALLRVMKDRSQQAYITVRDTGELGYHVEESPYGGVDTRAELRWTAVRAVERMGLTEALPDLLAALHDRHGVVRNHAARALWKLGYGTGIPVLLTALEAKAFENETANRILQEISGEDFGFDTDAGWARKNAAIERWRAWAAKASPDESRRPAFGSDAELDRRGRFLVAMLGQHQFLFMEQARRTLIDMEELGTQYVERVLESPLGDNTTLRAYSAHVLRGIASEASVALLQKLALDDDEDASVRARAVGALGSIARKGETRFESAPHILEALQAKDESLVIAAAKAIGEFHVAGGTGTEAATPRLTELLEAERSSGRLKRTAALSLVQIAGDEKARRHILGILETGKLHERADLIEMLSAWMGGETHGYDPNVDGGSQTAVLLAWQHALKTYDPASR